LYVINTIGWLPISIEVYFLFQYFVDINNKLRHECLIGVTIGALFAFLPAVLSLVLAIYIRERIGNVLFYISIFPFIISILGLVIMQIGTKDGI